VLNQLIDAGVANVHLDPTLTASDLLALGRRFKDFNPDTLDTYSVPTSFANVRGASVLKLDPIGAEPIFRLFRQVDGELSPNAPIVVQVNNGTGVPNQAEQVAEELRSVGFTVPVDNTGEADRFDYERTTIWYLPGEEAAGRQVARYLRAGALVEQTKLPLSTADVLVITGRDYAGLVDHPPVSTSLPSTTSPAGPAATAGVDTAAPTSTSLVGVVPQTPEDVSC
jgi:hypothetical protein